LPYLPLLRRSADVIIALDASADSQDVWFSRAAELARKYDAAPSTLEAASGAQKEEGVEQAGRKERSRWPAVDVEALFPAQVAAQQADGGGGKGDDDKVAVVGVKEHEKDAGRAADKVDAAKLQEGASGAKSDGERGGVRVENPQPAPVGSAPESAERAAHEAGEDKPMPSSQAREPPLGRCRCAASSSARSSQRRRFLTLSSLLRAASGSARPTPTTPPRAATILPRSTTCSSATASRSPTSRSRPTTSSRTRSRYFLRGSSTLRRTRRTGSSGSPKVRLALEPLFLPAQRRMDERLTLAFLVPAANFKAGEEQLKTLLKGVWLRKRQQRLADEARGGPADGAASSSTAH